jgi:pimeloyl-ACP methyl ester carboxylesterase
VWKYLWDDLSESYRIIHWHYRGHGRTPAPRDDDRLGIRDLVGDLGAVLDDAGAQRATVFGHSMGVQVALEAYRQMPKRVEALVLACGSPGRLLSNVRGGSIGEPALAAAKAALARAPRLVTSMWKAITPSNLSFSLAKWAEVNGMLLDRADFMPYLRGLARVSPWLFLSMLERAHEHDARDLLPEIRVPVLLIAGEHDGLTPRSLSEYMHAHIPDAKLLVVAGGTHTAPLERPQLVVNAVREFLAETALVRRVEPAPLPG